MPEELVLTKEESEGVKKFMADPAARKRMGLDRPVTSLGAGDSPNGPERTFSGLAKAMIALRSGRVGVELDTLKGLETHPQDNAFIVPMEVHEAFTPITPEGQMRHRLKGLQAGGMVQKAGLMEAAGGTGGALVPLQFIPQLQIFPLEPVNLRAFARIVPVASPTVRIPAILDTTHAGGTVFGGIIANWEGEAVTIPSSQPTFNSIELTARKLTLYTPVTNELLTDSAISIDVLVTELTRQAMAWKENKAILRGSGVGEPLGILNSGALVTIAKETNQVAATILYENINKMWDALWPAWRPGSIWVVNPECGQQLRSMSLTIGVAGAAAYLPAGGLSGAPFDTLMGRPIIYSEHASALGTVGDIILANMGNYLIGDRQQMTMAVSEHFLFGSDQTAFRLIERLDGKPWLTSALTPANGSLTYSSFVALATRG